MKILFDADPFDSPHATIKSLDLFFCLKEAIIKALLPIEEKVLLCDGVLILVLTPGKPSVEDINIAPALAREIYTLINKSVDFEKIVKNMRSSRNN